MNVAVRHSTIFRITATAGGQVQPAFAPVEGAYCFEEAYRSFVYNDEVALFSDLVEFNSMAFLFDGLDVPGFMPGDLSRKSEDVVKHGTVLDDGSILFTDGQRLPVEVIWSAYGLDVPEYGQTYGMR